MRVAGDDAVVVVKVAVAESDAGATYLNEGYGASDGAVVVDADVVVDH